MRMRRKKNLDSRVCNVAPYLMEADTTCVDQRIAIEDKHYIDLSCFDMTKPLFLELGCGKGKFALDFTAIHSEINYLAVEKLVNVIIVGAEIAKTRSLPNLRFLCTGAEYLPRFLPERVISKIFINFPCPFHKETYRDKRLTAPKYLEIYDRLMTENGEIWFKTDNKRMFEYSVETLSAYGFVLEKVTVDLHNSKYAEDNIVTEYEARYSAQGLPIYGLVAKRKKQPKI